MGQYKGPYIGVGEVQLTMAICKDGRVRERQQRATPFGQQQKRRIEEVGRREDC
jgi:hypothetical protein